MLTACHQSVLSSPPPPRRVGVNAGFVWRLARTPADAEHLRGHRRRQAQARPCIRVN